MTSDSSQHTTRQTASGLTLGKWFVLIVTTIAITTIVVVGQFHRQLSSLSQHQTDMVGQTLSSQTALNSSAMLLSQDWVSLNVSLKQLSEDPHVLGVEVINNQGELLAQAGSTGTQVFKQPIKANDALLGHLILYLNSHALEQNNHADLQPLYLTLSTALALLLVTLWLFKRYITHSVTGLKNAALELQQSNLITPLDQNTGGEFGQINRLLNQRFADPELLEEHFGENLEDQHPEESTAPSAANNGELHTGPVNSDIDADIADIDEAENQPATPFANASPLLAVNEAKAEQSYNSIGDAEHQPKPFTQAKTFELLDHNLPTPLLGALEKNPGYAGNPDNTGEQLGASSQLNEDINYPTNPSQTSDRVTGYAGISDNDNDNSPSIPFSEQASTPTKTPDLYMLYVDQSQSGSDALESETREKLLVIYKRFFERVCLLYSGSNQIDDQGNWSACFTAKPDAEGKLDSNKTGINALCASQLFKGLYRGFNQQRIRQFEPVLNLQFALVCGDEQTQLQHQAQQLSSALDSNELLTHQTLFEIEDIYQRLLADGHYKKENGDIYELSTVASNFQDLIDRQVEYLLTQISH